MKECGSSGLMCKVNFSNKIRGIRAILITKCNHE